MNRRPRRTCTLGDFVIAAFDVAASETTDSAEVARIATSAVEAVLSRRPNARVARALRELAAGGPPVPARLATVRSAA